MANLKLNVNGTDFAITANEKTSLLSVLRDNLHLTGAKPGCEEGQCGACTAFQCGFCTPGMIMATIALLNKNPHPTVDEIRVELNGNLCRCGTYSRIIKAVRQAAEGIPHA